MKIPSLVYAIALAAAPALAAVPSGTPSLPQSPSAPKPGQTTSAPTSIAALPLPPAVVDVGASLPGIGPAQQIAPPAITLPGLVTAMPYFDNGGTGGRLNTDLEVDTFGQANLQPVILYGLVFTDPPKHPLHLIGDLNGLPIDQRVDLP